MIENVVNQLYTPDYRKLIYIIVYYFNYKAINTLQSLV